MKTQTPYNWVKQVDPELLHCDQIPLTGASPPFPWDEFSARLAKCFELKDLAIHLDKVQWRSAKDLLEGLGDHPIPVYIGVPSMSGSLCWVMPEQEINSLMSLILTKESHPLAIQDPELRESFCRFIYMESLYQMSQINFDKTLTPCLNNKGDLPKEDSLCLDISVNLGGQSLIGRLIISSEFRQSWIERYERQAPSIRAQEIAKQADVLLHIEIGKTGFRIDEWNSVKPGDFIILDRCMWDPEKNEGLVKLTSNGIPVLSGHLDNGQVKIIEFSQYNEAEATYGQ